MFKKWFQTQVHMLMPQRNASSHVNATKKCKFTCSYEFARMFLNIHNFSNIHVTMHKFTSKQTSQQLVGEKILMVSYQKTMDQNNLQFHNKDIAIGSIVECWHSLVINM